MQSDIAIPDPFPTAEAAVPDTHKLAVYYVAVAFQAAAMRLLPKGHAVLRDQLERASLSIVLNIAEAMVPHCLRLCDAHEKRGDWAR